MPSAVEIKLWCDPCSTENQWVEGEYTPAVTFNPPRTKPRRLILCAKHEKEIYTPFHDLLMSSLAETVDSSATTIPVSRNKSAPNPGQAVGCPVDGCEWGPVKHIYTVRDHLIRDHDMPESEARSMVGMRPKKNRSKGAA